MQGAAVPSRWVPINGTSNVALNHPVRGRVRAGRWPQLGFVSRPQPSVRSESGRGEKLRVDISDTQPVELLCLDQFEDLGICGDLSRWEGTQQTQDVLPLGQVAEDQFANHPRVSEIDLT